MCTDQVVVKRKTIEAANDDESEDGTDSIPWQSSKETLNRKRQVGSCHQQLAPSKASRFLILFSCNFTEDRQDPRIQVQGHQGLHQEDLRLIISGRPIRRSDCSSRRAVNNITLLYKKLQSFLYFRLSYLYDPTLREVVSVEQPHLPSEYLRHPLVERHIALVKSNYDVVQLAAEAVSSLHLAAMIGLLFQMWSFISGYISSHPRRPSHAMPSEATASVDPAKPVGKHAHCALPVVDHPCKIVINTE